MTTTTSAPVAAPTPQEFGVGARVTLAVMRDDYVDVILGALRATDVSGLTVATDPVSTFVGGDEQSIVRFLVDLTGRAAASGAHVSATITFSRGCPGEVACSPTVARASEVPSVERVGRDALAQWALYPLSDAPSADHMRDIYAAIDHAKELGTFAGSEHFVTNLRGDLADVIATAAAGWVLVGRTVPHVTSHLTVSLNSPSVA
ncbi:YKOF-related protein [Diaminobutyricimonas aerilata]|uniref:YKOF-related protein n=1 Tax=Diaminobutyricimonas aerilata TaxID=1162967 RepID=A0A2M9CKU9_9MICO|nr:YkoF family thiamine/hydroxymethylpyrimidine-binding protein [Diaminobutyricimonas aerilata]PJJ72526.1 YKOF-related protein [Diaminobutyricimonas aerilata]